VARRFGRTRHANRRFLMRSSFCPGLSPFGCSGGLWTARASKIELAPWRTPNTSDRLPQWVELDLGRKGDRAAEASAWSGRTAEWLFTARPSIARFLGHTLEFDREKLVWNRAPVSISRTSVAVGADGQRLSLRGIKRVCGWFGFDHKGSDKAPTHVDHFKLGGVLRATFGPARSSETVKRGGE